MKLRELHEAATPGTWGVCMFSDGMCVFREHPKGMLASRVVKESKPESHHDAIVRWLGDSPQREANLKLIAYLRNHAQDFIALIEAADAADTDWNVTTAAALRESLKPFAGE